MPVYAIELAVLALLCALILLERTPLLRLAEYPRWCMLALFLVPVVLRLALLGRYPVPAPYVSDDFAQLLSADTLAHFRLANPTHPFSRFFETFFTLQQPTYSSMLPPGQGLLLAAARLLTGSYWAGVVVSVGALSALVFWMLRAWVTPGWAGVGGLLAAAQFGPLCEWMNSYWGGALAGCAGCLVFGGLPRGNYLLVGIGLAIHAITRPFETLFLLAGVLLYVLYKRPGRTALLPALPPLAGALLLTMFHNHAVTGNWFQLPYQLSRYEYGVPTTLTFQANPEPHRQLTREQQLTIDVQHLRHGDGESPAAFFQRLLFRVRFFRFFFLAPLYLALPFFLPSLRQLRFLWVAGVIALFVVGGNFYPYFYPHYVAGITSLLCLAAVLGLERLARFKAPAASWLVRISLAHFAFWFGLLAFGTASLEAMKPFATWHVINIGDPEGRILIRRHLESVPGQHLVFVHYWALHTFREWVHNSADIDGQRIVWARDLGEHENAKLRAYYPNRKAWMLEPDAAPPRLSPDAGTSPVVPGLGESAALPDDAKLHGIGPGSYKVSPTKR